MTIEVAERLLLVARRTGADVRLGAAREIEWTSSAVEFGEFEAPRAESYLVPMNQLSVEFLEQNFRDGAAPEILRAPIGDHLTLLGKKIPMGQVFISLKDPRPIGDLQATIEVLRGLPPPQS